MTLLPILVFIAIALLTGWIVPPRWRIGLVLVTSLLAIFWLQPGLPIRNLDFWLPVISILLTFLVWAVVQPPERLDAHKRKILLLSGSLVVGVILSVSLTRYLGSFCCITPTRPPELLRVIIFLTIGAGIALLPVVLPRLRHNFSAIIIILIIGLFVLLKSPRMLQIGSSMLRSLTGQSLGLAAPQDIVWFGFSFLAFRLLHVLFDYRSGKLEAYQLDEFMTYVLFFPTITAGPIDRSQRFITDLRLVGKIPQDKSNQNRRNGSQRILWGIFKKFVLADSLALIALNSQNAPQVTSSLWMWLLLYAYALRIYFDFSGYTDIAIGLGLYLGIKLPENFDQPYLKTNLTTFWNSWHITLAQWFRAYYFNPATRSLRTRSQKAPAWIIIFFGQVSTMLLIGLWHGITWNFAIWGVWHGLGLFIHNRWSGWVRSRQTGLENRPYMKRVVNLGGWFLTFNYVALGWVWFALPTVSLSLDVYQKLIGIS